VLALWLLWRPASSAAEQDLAAKTADLLPAVATRIVGNGPTWMLPACERCPATSRKCPRGDSVHTHTAVAM
jgi:hypothetical protein